MISKINGIPFKFLTFRGSAANFRIGDSRQLVFIPRKYVNNDGSIKVGSNLNWWFSKTDTQIKIRYYMKEKGGDRK